VTRTINRPRRTVAVVGIVLTVLFWAAIVRTAFQAFVVVRRTQAQVAMQKNG
jgi:hypothetical protein